MKLKAAVFDMDGTLTDTMRVIPLLLAEEFSVPTIGPNFRKFQNFIAPYYYNNHNWLNKTLIFHLAETFNRSLLSVFFSFLRMGIRYFKGISETRLFPDINESLIETRNLGLKLGLATNGRYFEVKHKLPQSIVDLFEVIMTKEWGIPKKPKPDLILYAAKKLKIIPKEIVYIGDTLADFLASSAAGCEFILVSTGTFGPDTVLIDGKAPENIVRDLRDVPKEISKKLND